MLISISGTVFPSAKQHQGRKGSGAVDAVQRTFGVLFRDDDRDTNDLQYGSICKLVCSANIDHTESPLTLATLSILLVVVTTLSKSLIAGPIHRNQWDVS